jgi:uncharacterized protein
VTRLVRRSPAGQGEIAWDPRAPGGGIALGALDGLDAVIHLAGAGIADHRWSPGYQGEIPASRVMGTRALAAALAAAGPRPALLSVPAPALRLGPRRGDQRSAVQSPGAARRVTEAGFPFQFPDRPAALAAELGRPAA